MAKDHENKPIQVLIVDDESLGRKRVRDLLKGVPEFEIVGECENGKDAIQAISLGNADLILLDIQMQDMDGFDVIKDFEPDLLPKVIFITAYDQYALKAFEFHAIDYLLKPFDDERFRETLDHAKRQIRKDNIQELGSKLTSLLSDVKSSKARGDRVIEGQHENFQRRLVIKSMGKISFVEVGDIDWIGAEGSYVSLNINKKTHLMRATLKKLESMLNPEEFLRIHRSTIVNVSAIKELQSHFHGEFVVVLKTGKRLKLSRSYRANAEKLLGGKL